MAAIAPPAALTPQRYRFTVEQYYQLAAAGILTEDDRVELIEGEIIKMAAIGPTHSWLVANLNRSIMRQANDEIRVDVQSPIHLGPHSEPEPDFCLARRIPGHIAHPTPPDIYFVIEVADTTLAYDRDTKLPLYAAAGIPESWLFNVKARLLERHTNPHNGVYQQIARIGHGQSLTSTTLPAITLAMDDVLR